jgi:hypothetical protein
MRANELGSGAGMTGVMLPPSMQKSWKALLSITPLPASTNELVCVSTNDCTPIQNY